MDRTGNSYKKWAVNRRGNVRRDSGAEEDGRSGTRGREKKGRFAVDTYYINPI